MNHQCHQSAHEALVEPRQVLDDRHAVHDHELLDGVGMVERGAAGDQRAAVVADDGEALVPEVRISGDDVGRPSRAWRTARGRAVGRQGGAPVAAQVRADHGVAFRERGRDAMPGRVRAGMAVEQQDRRVPGRRGGRAV